MFCRLSVNSKVKGSDRLMFTSLLCTWYDNIVLRSCENFNYRKALGRVVSDVWGPELGASSASDGSCSSVCGSVCAQSQGCEIKLYFAWSFHYKCHSQSWLCGARPTRHCGEGSSRKAVSAFAELQNWSTQLVQEILEEISAAPLSIPLVLCFSWDLWCWKAASEFHFFWRITCFSLRLPSSNQPWQPACCSFVNSLQFSWVMEHHIFNLPSSTLKWRY